MFHVPRTVGFGYHVRFAVLFSPWSIMFKVDAIVADFQRGARMLVLWSALVRTAGHLPFHSKIRLSLS